MPVKIIKSAGGLANITFGITDPTSDPPNSNIYETGINISKFQVRYYPEVNERWKNYAGDTVVRAVDINFSRDIAIEGEYVGGLQGIMALALGTAVTFANKTNEWNSPAIMGAIFLDEITVNKARGAWKTITARFSANPWLAAP